MALFSVVTGVLVLVSAIAASRRQRVRESVLLKTLGATRARLLALLAEDLVSDVAGTRRTGLAREAIALADASPDPALLARICS